MEKKVNIDDKILADKIRLEFEKKGITVTKQRSKIIHMVCSQSPITDLDEEWVKLRLTDRISWATMRVTIRLMQKLGLLISEKSDNMKRQFRLNLEAITKQPIEIVTK